MSISAAYLQILLDGGKDVPESIEVARAMERGDDRNIMYVMVDGMQEAGASAKAMAIAMCELASKINEQNARYMLRLPRVADEHTFAKDSNRSRRAMPDTEWRALRLEIFERDGHACQYCGATDDLTCDHITPLVRGGTNDNENLTTACRSCNSSKGDKLLSEWPRYGN